MFVFNISFAQKAIDGDTFYYNGLKIRLYAIDSPEKGCQGAEESKDCLKRLLSHHILRYDILKYDRYGRAICRVYVNNKNVSYEMVRLGYSYVYKRYCTDFKFHYVEEKAKAEKKGIWKYKYINPEKYRHGMEIRN